LGELRGDLVERREDEPVELDLADGPVAAHGEADGRADDAGLRERRVHDALLAELGLQPVGHAEDAAQRADVLAHEHDLVVVPHRGPQALVDGLAERERPRARGGAGRGLGTFRHGRHRAPPWAVSAIAYWSAGGSPAS